MTQNFKYLFLKTTFAKVALLSLFLWKNSECEMCHWGQSLHRHRQSPFFPAWLQSLRAPELWFPQQSKKSEEQSRQGDRFVILYPEEKRAKRYVSACLMHEARGLDTYQHQRAFLYGLKSQRGTRQMQEFTV